MTTGVWPRRLWWGTPMSSLGKVRMEWLPGCGCCCYSPSPFTLYPLALPRPTHAGIYAFVILRDGVADSEEMIRDRLRSLVREKIGSFAVPQQFLVRAQR